jgi:hypothetical protein
MELADHLPGGEVQGRVQAAGAVALVATEIPRSLAI